MALGRIAQPGGARVRMADGGSLLETALNSVSAPDPSGQSRIVNPFPGNYLTYGEGPEWNWFDYLNSGGQGGGAPPPPGGGTTTPPPITGGEGSGVGTGFGAPVDHDPGGRGQFGGGTQAAAQEAADRNVAQNPSLRDALKMATSFAGPFGALSLAAKTALSQFGIGQNPFNDPRVQTMSPSQIASIATSLQGIPDSVPAVVRANLINNAIVAARAQGTSNIAGNTGAGVGQIGNQPATGGVDLGGLASRMGGNPGSVGGGRNAAGGYGVASGLGGNSQGTNIGGGGRGDSGYGGGGDRGAGTQGGPGGSPGGGLGGGYRLARGGRLRFAGGGSSSNPGLTSILPILAGIIGSATSGPIGGAVASGAATAMTGGSLQDAIVNIGPDTIDTFFKYFGPLLGLDGSGQPQDANTNVGQATGSSAGAAFLKALTQPAPTITSGQQVLPYTPSTRYAAGGELDARHGLHVEGPGDGQSDDIPAQLSNNEYVFDAGTVAMAGSGSSSAGAKKLDELRHAIRAKAGMKNPKKIIGKGMSVAQMLGKLSAGKKAA